MSVSQPFSTWRCMAPLLGCLSLTISVSPFLSSAVILLSPSTACIIDHMSLASAIAMLWPANATTACASKSNTKWLAKECGMDCLPPVQHAGNTCWVCAGSREYEHVLPYRFVCGVTCRGLCHSVHSRHRQL